jgi:hypothetical protein
MRLRRSERRRWGDEADVDREVGEAGRQPVVVGVGGGEGEEASVEAGAGELDAERSVRPEAGGADIDQGRGEASGWPVVRQRRRLLAR